MNTLQENQAIAAVLTLVTASDITWAETAGQVCKTGC